MPVINTLLVLVVAQMQSIRSYLTLNITPELIKPELQLLTKITPKLSLQSCPPSAANTTLGLCYTCVVLYCSAHGCLKSCPTIL